MVNVSDKRATDLLPACVLPKTPMLESILFPNGTNSIPQNQDINKNCLQKCGSCADVRYVTKISVSQRVPKHVLLLKKCFCNSAMEGMGSPKSPWVYTSQYKTISNK